MQNRLDSYTRDCIQALFKDGAWMWVKQKEWVRDLSRLLSQLETRGISLLTADLPSVEKHLNKCLDQGTFTPSGLVLTRPRRGEKIPLFLREIFLRIFDPNGEMRADPCSNAVLFLKTLFSFAKKLRIACSKENVYEEVRNFIHVDANLRSPSLNWDRDDLGVEHGVPLAGGIHLTDFCDEAVLGAETYSKIRDILAHTQRCFDIVASGLGLPPRVRGRGPEARHRPKHGPGVVSNLSKGDSKYRFPSWPDKLQLNFPYDEYAVPTFGHGFSSTGDLDFNNKESASKLIAVPKTVKKPRLIAAEPVEHQWIQQLVKDCLVEALSNSVIRDSINFFDQTLNQAAAQKGSATGLQATVDLSEASDRVSLFLLERCLRANYSWLEDLHACRTRSLTYELEGEQNTIVLRKFAAMGSACTFPVQTLLFSVMAISATLLSRGKQPNSRTIREASRSVRVFGDDIIVDTVALDHLRVILQICGLKVNESKTFSGKFFRESCGIDAFRGDNVTPPRILEIPRGLGSLASIVETSNNFHKAGFWHTAECIRNHLSKWNHLIPITRDRDLPTSLFSFCGDYYDHLRSRKCSKLHGIRIRILLPRTKEQPGKMEPRERIMQYFTENPSPTTNWKSGFSTGRTTMVVPGWVTLT